MDKPGICPLCEGPAPRSDLRRPKSDPPTFLRVWWACSRCGTVKAAPEKSDGIVCPSCATPGPFETRRGAAVFGKQPTMEWACRHCGHLVAAIHLAERPA